MTTTIAGLKKPSRLAFFEIKWGYIFIFPWILGFIGFTLLPTLATLALSFTNFNLVNANDFQFVGLTNYWKLLEDPIVYDSLWITFKFTMMAVPVGLIFPLALAALMNSQSLLGKQLFRTLFYMPYIVPLVSGVFIWQGFLGTEAGWLNLMLEAVGLPRPDWLFTATWIYPALLIISLWGVGNSMLTMLAGMQGVSPELYDAAKLDGAGPLQSFRHITFPMISPIIFYNIVLSVIGTFNYFVVPLVLKGTKGDPGNATMFYNMYLYKTFFKFQDMAYGATLSWVMFLVILVFTAFLFGTAKYWVFYPNEGR